MFDAAGNLRTGNDDAPGEYVAEWKITGLCADCQDALEALEDAEVKRHHQACKDYSAFLDLWGDLLGFKPEEHDD